MIKWITIILMVLVSVNIAQALDMCKDTVDINTNCVLVTPVISCTNYTYEIFDQEGDLKQNDTLTLMNGSVYYFNFTLEEGNYLIKLCDGSTREIHVEQEDEDMTAGISVTLFILVITLFFFVFPIFKREFTGHPVTDLIISRGMIVVGLFLMTMNTAIISTIAVAGGINVEHDLLNTYMWLFGWGGWIAIVWLCVGTIFRCVRLWQEIVDNKRMGNE